MSLKPKIQKLPQSLANQIAAGEVVERPASVVKELLENAVDAGAKKISLEIEQGGVSLVRVTDDGCGIGFEDLPLTIAPHATSKIKQLADLFAIQTLGFRGEALASISSVSHITITSKTKEDTQGHSLVKRASEVANIHGAAHPVGTTISVESLFINTPVRRKFLRSERTELNHIENVIKRMALSHFSISWRFIVDGKQQFLLPVAFDRAAMTQRVKKLFGQTFMSQSCFIDEQALGFRLWGWLARPEFMRSQNDLQFIYINRRMVKDKLLNHAIRQVYEPLLYPGRQAAFLLFLELSPDVVDVNVHPTKHEVRFHEPRQVHDFISTRLERALFTNEAREGANSQSQQKEQQTDSNIRVEAKHAALSFHTLNQATVEYRQEEKLITVDKGFALYQSKKGMVLLDVVKTYQASLKQQLLTQYQEKQALKSRPVLVPLSYNLAHSPKLTLKQLEALGLSLSSLDDNQWVLRSFPILTPHLNFELLMKNLPSLTTPTEVIETLVYASQVELTQLDNIEKQRMIEIVIGRDSKSKISRLLSREDWGKLLCQSFV